jgi:hypothetical protein
MGSTLLNVQIDDMLNGNRLYAPTMPECPNSVTCPTYLMTGPDLQSLAAWQTSVQVNPQFPSFRGTFAYNGVGASWLAPNDPLFAAIKTAGTQFWWVSHTWDHENLDCYTLNNGVCQPADLSQSQFELNQNISIAPTLGITIDRTGMVTPYNGGVTNGDFLQAAIDAGILYIGYAPQTMPSPNTGVVNLLFPSILEVPRVAPNLFDDVSSPLTSVPGSWPDEYNAMYGPTGSKPVYSQNQTYKQILDIESDSVLLGSMLTYAPYPQAFHVGNAASYDGTHSVLTDLIDATIAKYTSVVNLPVITLEMSDIGALLANRASYDASGVIGVYTPGVGVVLTTNKAAMIPVTGACSQSMCSVYGGRLQDNVSISAGSSVTLSLAAAQGVTPAAVVLNPASLTGGATAAGTVRLSEPAPTNGVLVALSSDNPLATIPAAVNIAAGNSSATFTVTTAAVTSGASATITASYNGVTRTAALNIAPPVTLSSVALNPVSVTAGQVSTGTIRLSNAAPVGGVVVSLVSNTVSATVPASVNVPAGSLSATFTVTTAAVTSGSSATITASYNGVSKTAGLAILVPQVIAPPSTLSFTAGNMSIAEGSSIHFGSLTLAMQGDGNLVLYNGATALWDTGTSGQSCGTNQCVAVFQADGNFVVYNGSKALWSSGTYGNSNELFFSGETPQLEIVGRNQSTLWKL